jgi:hypothetical protein
MTASRPRRLASQQVCGSSTPNAISVTERCVRCQAPDAEVHDVALTDERPSPNVKGKS